MDTRQKSKKGQMSDARIRNIDETSSDTIIVHTDPIEDGEVVDEVTHHEHFLDTTDTIKEARNHKPTTKSTRTRTPKKQSAGSVADIALTVQTALQQFSQRLEALEVAKAPRAATPADTHTTDASTSLPSGSGTRPEVSSEGDIDFRTLGASARFQRAAEIAHRSNRARRHTSQGIAERRTLLDSELCDSSGSSVGANPINRVSGDLPPSLRADTAREDQFGVDRSAHNATLRPDAGRKDTRERGTKRNFDIMRESDREPLLPPLNVRSGMGLTASRSEWLTSDHDHLYNSYMPASDLGHYSSRGSHLPRGATNPSIDSFQQQIQPDPAYVPRTQDFTAADADALVMRDSSRLGFHGSAMPFTTCGDGVPLKIRNKIGKNEYVDMHELEFSLVKKGGEDSSLIIDLANAQAPSVSRAPSSRHPLTFNQWSRCFHKYMSIYLQYHGKLKPLELALDMIAYHEVVRDLWERQARWAAFDEHFRRRKESYPCTWSDKDVIFDLRLTYGTPSQQVAANVKQQSAPRGQRNFDSKHVPKFFCTEFHTSGKCTRVKCDYSHHCYRCKDWENPHSASTCQKFNKKPSSYHVVSPVLPKMLSYLLEVSEYDHSLAAFLIDGFTNGFKLGHAAPLRNNEKVPQVKKDEADIIQKN